MKPNPLSPEQICDLIRDFAGFYVGEGDKLNVRVQVAKNGSAYFAMQGTPEDDSRLVGRGGCHVNALTFLIAKFGTAQDKVFTFRLITKPSGKSQMYPPRNVLDYNPQPASKLLSRILETLGVGEHVIEVNPGDDAGRGLAFNFDVKIKDRVKAHALTLSEPPMGLSPIACLGTLMRAIARNSGVHFQVNLVD